MEIPILYNESYLSLGVSSEIAWYPDKAPHAIIVGNTGSGKTYFSKLLLGKICLYAKNAKLYIADFKGDQDFIFLKGCSHFYRYSECLQALEEFYSHLEFRQQEKEPSSTMLVLFFDEWASFCNSLDKKTLEEAKKKLATLLMLGRSFHMHVIISQQRADASYFATARDNFNIIISMACLSEESKNMLFHEFKDEMKSDRKQGTGYMLTNGTNLTAIQVPTIQDIKKLHQFIKQGVER